MYSILFLVFVRERFLAARLDMVGLVVNGGRKVLETPKLRFLLLLLQFISIHLMRARPDPSPLPLRLLHSPFRQSPHLFPTSFFQSFQRLPFRK